MARVSGRPMGLDVCLRFTEALPSQAYPAAGRRCASRALHFGHRTLGGHSGEQRAVDRQEQEVRWSGGTLVLFPLAYDAHAAAQDGGTRSLPS